MLKDGKGRTFYAVGGTWRALARLHMWQTGYPLHVMHGYAIAGRRGARVRPAGASRRCRDAVQHRSRDECAAAAARLCGAGARIRHPHRQAEADRVLGARRARGAALFAAQAKRQGKGRADRGGARSQPVALAFAAAWRGTDRLDRSLHGVVGPRRAGRGTPSAPRRVPVWPTSAGGRIPIIAASNRSTSSPMAASPPSIIPAAPIWRSPCSTAMSDWSWTTSCRRGCANSPRPA